MVSTSVPPYRGLSVLGGADLPLAGTVLLWAVLDCPEHRAMISPARKFICLSIPHALMFAQSNWLTSLLSVGADRVTGAPGGFEALACCGPDCAMIPPSAITPAKNENRYRPLWA